MSLSGAIFIGMSGMDAFTQGLQTISNNVANLNTAGYKQLTTNFSDLFNASNGDGSGEQPDGNGVQSAPNQIDYTEGTLQQTGGNLDLAIQGNGFFVLQDGSSTVYARTGSFAVDSSGYITEQGTQKRLTVLNASGQPVALNVNSFQTDPATATTSVSFESNLSSGATSDSVSNIQVYDSTGAEHTWQVALAPSTTGANGAAAAGTWTVTVTDETGATVGTGTIAFNGGAIDPSNEAVTVNASYTGAKPLSVALDFSAVTSFATGTTSTLQVNTANGNAAGSLTGVTVNSSGQIQLSYSNNQTQLEGSVAIATFLNTQNLHEASGGVFQDTQKGAALLSASGQNGAGTIVTQQIEGSNVDLTQEFGDLILIQRGYQASSEVVSIANDMIQDLFGIRGQG
jgi:flagellar hook protein FlgE